MTRILPAAADDEDALHGAFLRAFSDYQVPFRLDRREFGAFLRARGVDFGLSALARDDDGVVGFWITGLERQGGRTRAYDIATGVAPEARGRGIARRLFDQVAGLLDGARADSCVLEVLHGNEAAKGLYDSLGFRTVRELDCYRWPDGVPPTTVPDGYRMRNATDPRGDIQPAFRDWSPSWQNSDAAIERAGDDAEGVVAVEGERVVGYGVLWRSTQAVAQLAIDPRHRGRGLGRALLGELSRRLGAGIELRFINVPRNQVATRELLLASGGEIFISQHEMELRLS